MSASEGTMTNSNSEREARERIEACLALFEKYDVAAQHRADFRLILAALDRQSVMLKKAADQFAFYADEHAKKGTEEADSKAMANHGWALACAHAALTASTKQGEGE